MRKGLLFLLIIFLFAITSTAFDRQHLLAGVIIAVLTVLIFGDLFGRLPKGLSLKSMLQFLKCLLLLVWYVIDSCFSVAKTILFRKPDVSPVLLSLEPGLESRWGRIFLATCITLTPGSVTVDIQPETGRFLVHTLTEEIGDSLADWPMIDEIKKLEMLMKRR